MRSQAKTPTTDQLASRAQLAAMQAEQDATQRELTDARAAFIAAKARLVAAQQAHTATIDETKMLTQRHRRKFPDDGQ